MEQRRRDAQSPARGSARDRARGGVRGPGVGRVFDESPLLRRLSVLLGVLSVRSASGMILAALGALGAAGSTGTGAGPGSDGVIAALALAAVVTTACAVAALAVVLLAASVGLKHTRRCDTSDDADLPTVITQSRPDAPGRPRTRAPGRLLAIA